ncbi:MAG: alpha/beta hydrolase, partial [Chloroflexi bacterium]|nr:alpha/beta hydrolase [Chloroflexota bacterium]
RGHGLSDKPAGGYQLTDYTDDIAALIKSLGLGKPIVMGHSMGARIVAQLAADHPNVIGKAIMIDPPSGGPGRRTYPTTLEQFRANRANLEARGIAAIRERNPNATEEYIQVRARWGLLYSMRAMEESWRGFHAEEIYSIIGQMRCPGLFLWAENGDVVRDEEAEEYRRANPDVQYVKIMRSGHGIPWDNWPDFIAAVDAFLAQE